MWLLCLSEEDIDLKQLRVISLQKVQNFETKTFCKSEQFFCWVQFPKVGRGYPERVQGSGL